MITMRSHPDDMSPDDGSAAIPGGAEALDEDLLEHDPWAAALDPPDGWAESDRAGITGPEQREGPSLEERLAQEEREEGRR
ncbi:hypothetical protein AXK56_11430 [Tsukamurella pulmonis]|nr:hypothetical protein AXK56_11430 [Tsukamurella pulmonis]